MTTSSNFIPVPSYLDQPGPKVLAGAARVYNGGKTMRLSPEVLAALYQKHRVLHLEPWVDVKTRELQLRAKEDTSSRTYRTWKSHSKSKSELLSMVGILPLLHISETEAPGDYRAETSGDTIHIYFGERLKVSGYATRRSDRTGL